MTGLVALYIPDVPSKVTTQIQRENQLAREEFFEMEIQQAKEKKKTEDKVQVNINIYFDSINVTSFLRSIRNSELPIFQMSSLNYKLLLQRNKMSKPLSEISLFSLSLSSHTPSHKAQAHNSLCQPQV